MAKDNKVQKETEEPTSPTLDITNEYIEALESRVSNLVLALTQKEAHAQALQGEVETLSEQVSKLLSENSKEDEETEES